MLFRSKTLTKISSGEVTMAIRKWKRPTVKQGGTLITGAGMLRIDSVEEILLADISDTDLKKSGYTQREHLLENIHNKKEGIIYKICFHLEGEDPRIALRQNSNISEEEFQLILTKLTRMDKYSKRGAWTVQILNVIEMNPERLAQELANEMGVEKSWFKPNVRKLKKLGLTISHSIGYSISPRGNTYLKMYRRRN